MYSTELINFSHTLRVMYVSCIECDRVEALELLGIYFSDIDVVKTKDEAFEHFLENKYDVIITGLRVPTIRDGLKLIEQIREVSRDITILSIDSELQHFEFTKLIEYGVDGFIIKPLSILQFSDVVHKVLEKIKNKEDIYHYRVDLEKKVNEQVESLRQKDKMLIQQSKLAAMGEMMDAVAHQWKHPLTIIKMNTDMLKFDFEDKFINKEYIETFEKKIFNNISHMTTTLDEFRSFFRPDKETKLFSIATAIEKSILLMKDELSRNVIKIDKNIDEDITIDGIENEFKHIILNLLANSKDAFVSNKIENRQIAFKLYTENQKIIFKIEDNAGGVPLEVIEDIFKANVTTKKSIGGTGIGLYLTRQIVEKHSGTIEVKNINNGSCFIITFEMV